MTDDPIREELNQLVVAHRLTEIMKPFHPVDMVPAVVALDLLREKRELEWQPIETAPIGQTIDLYTDWAGVRDIDCHWDGVKWATWKDEGDGAGWIEVPNPTHWKRIDTPKEEPHAEV